MKSILKRWKVLLILLFLPSLCLGASYPPQIAQKLRHAVPIVDCKRKSPTNIHLRFYADKDDTWDAFVLGRNGKNVLIFFGEPESDSVTVYTHRAQSRDGWKDPKTIKLSKGIDNVMSIFTQEEINFLARCKNNYR